MVCRVLPRPCRHRLATSQSQSHASGKWLQSHASGKWLHYTLYHSFSGGLHHSFLHVPPKPCRHRLPYDTYDSVSAWSVAVDYRSLGLVVSPPCSCTNSRLMHGFLSRISSDPCIGIPIHGLLLRSYPLSANKETPVFEVIIGKRIVTKVEAAKLQNFMRLQNNRKSLVGVHSVQ